MTHSDVLASLRRITTTHPLPAPRVIYAHPDGRHQLGRAAKGAATASGQKTTSLANEGNTVAALPPWPTPAHRDLDRPYWWLEAEDSEPGPSPIHTCPDCGYTWQRLGRWITKRHNICEQCGGVA